jgi:hypothetical protein
MSEEDMCLMDSIRQKISESDAAKCPEIGDWVDTPRFLRVRVQAIFTEIEDAYAAGYTEPTHFDGAYKILGKTYRPNYMRFAAVIPNALSGK